MSSPLNSTLPLLCALSWKKIKYGLFTANTLYKMRQKVLNKTSTSEKIYRTLPSGTEDMNPRNNAGDTGLIPWYGKILMPWATKPMCHRYWAQL